jgi:hypothetical protein
MCLFLFLFVVIGGGLHLNPGGAFIAAATGTPLLIYVFNRPLVRERIEPNLCRPPKGDPAACDAPQQRPTERHSCEVGEVVRQWRACRSNAHDGGKCLPVLVHEGGTTMCESAAEDRPQPLESAAPPLQLRMLFLPSLSDLAFLMPILVLFLCTRVVGWLFIDPVYQDRVAVLFEKTGDKRWGLWVYVGRELRGPWKRFVMSAAKEIVIVEHSEERSVNASKEAGSNGSGGGTTKPAVDAEGPPAVRRRLPDERHSLTHHFSVGGQEGYVTVGLYEDGLPGELFIRMAKEGSTVSGLMDSFATAVSLALQYGVPLRGPMRQVQPHKVW